MINPSSDLAIRATVLVALHSSKLEATEVFIAKELDAPVESIRVILDHLLDLGLIGVVGNLTKAYFLIVEDATTLVLSTLTEAVDDDHVHDGCGFGLKECARPEPCHLHHEFVEIRNILNDRFKDTAIPKLELPS